MEKKRNWIRGLLGGLLLGIGVTFLMVSYSIVLFGDATIWLVLPVFLLLGLALSLLGPQRGGARGAGGAKARATAGVTT